MVEVWSSLILNGHSKIVIIAVLVCKKIDNRLISMANGWFDVTHGLFNSLWLSLMNGRRSWRNVGKADSLCRF